jgi:hypothetical protein
MYHGAVALVWWYIVARFAIVSLIVVHETGQGLRSARPNLLHEDGRCGLAPIGELSWSLLLMYFGILGIYLFLAFVLGAQRKVDAMWVALLVVYLIVPAFWLYQLLWRGHRLIDREKDEELRKIDGKLRQRREEAERASGRRYGQTASEVLALHDRKRQILAFSSWPIGLPKTAAALSVYVLVPASGALNAVGYFEKAQRFLWAILDGVFWLAGR